MVSRVGIGAWQWGSRGYWGYGKAYGKENIREIVERARTLDVNFIDTAEVYGWGASEELIGEIIGNDDEFIIASKYLPIRPSWPGVERAVRGSLRRLRRDVIDLYQVHWPMPLVSVHALMKNLEKEVKKGRIRYIGVSNYNARLLKAANEALSISEIVSDQLHFNLIDRSIEENGLLSYCRDNHVSMIAWSPLEQGLLTGKYHPGTSISGLRRLRQDFSKRNIERLQPLLSALKQASADHGRTAAQGALAWILQNDNNIVIPGVKKVEQLVENVGGQSWRFTYQELKTLEKAYQSYRKT